MKKEVIVEVIEPTELKLGDYILYRDDVCRVNGYNPDSYFNFCGINYKDEDIVIKKFNHFYRVKNESKKRKQNT